MAVDEISVLLATYNGARFLNEQLQTIEAQRVGRINIWAGDDGSSDKTLEILASWQERWKRGEFHLIVGPGKGYVENFRHLVIAAASERGYLAFSDQDDIWDRDKLSIAIAFLKAVPLSEPALYGGRTRIVGSDGQMIGMSPLFKRRPTFSNALVQSIAGGNTMVLNRTAANLLAETCELTSFVSHDWWCYQIVSGAGGHVIYDPSPRIGYRQHEGNAIGENQGWQARVKRIAALADGHFAVWNDCNIRALERCRDKLSDESKCLLDAFQDVRIGGPSRAVCNLWRYGIRRQTFASDLALYAAAALGKL